MKVAKLAFTYTNINMKFFSRLKHIYTQKDYKNLHKHSHKDKNKDV